MDRPFTVGDVASGGNTSLPHTYLQGPIARQQLTIGDVTRDDQIIEDMQRRAQETHGERAGKSATRSQEK